MPFVVIKKALLLVVHFALHLRSFAADAASRPVSRRSMMKNYLLTGTIVIATCCSLIGLAQDGPKPVATKATPADKGDAKAEKKGRLPANYGKIGLTEPQKTKIYGIQGKYDDQLDALEKQIETLKEKRDHEVEAVLTDDQKKILKNLVDTSKETKKTKKEPATDEGKTEAKAEKK